MAHSRVIDLTIDDDDDNDDKVLAPFVFRAKSSKAPASIANGRPGPTYQPSVPTPTPSQTRARGSSHLSLPSQKPLAINCDSYNRPAKRRKFDASASSNGTQGESRTETGSITSISREALMKCLRLQVIPHLDAAIAELPRGLYNTAELGQTIIGQVADKDFEYHFHRGNGRLTREVELHVADRIQHLVRDLTKDHKYRAPTSTSTLIPPPNGAVIPSIEDRQSSRDAAPQGELVDEFEEEYMDLDLDDEDEDEFEEEYEELEPELPGTPTPPPLPKKKPPITPQRLRTRAKAPQWQSGRVFETKREGTPPTRRNPWFGLTSRPYLKAYDRQRLMSGISNTRKPIRLGAKELQQPSTIHVDFNEDEVRFLGYVARALYGREAVRPRDYLRDLRHLLKKDRDRMIRTGIIEAVRQGFDGYHEPPTSLLTRSDIDVANYLDDLFLRKINVQPKSLRIERDDSDGQGDMSRANVVPSTLLAREIGGNRLSSTRRYQNFTMTFKSNREDALEPRIEWTGCAGDITTISWLSNMHFVCGTTTHSDSHNQQYNKPGNLLLGSVTSKTLRAYPDHRIIRPIISQGDNALDSMRESQDPWLFTSVVSSDYEPMNDLAFTSSFDKTVKVWKLEGDTMKTVGTWHHEGRVNFVVASKDHHGMIATAADVPTDAVRVYQVNASDVSSSRYDSYSCTRVHDEDYVPSEKWAYFPAAIRWGLGPEAKHLLLIGYSPRSLYGEDHEIPEDKRNSGELCLWDTTTRTQVRVSSAATQNVFEVAWHPVRNLFAAATSASGLELEGNINTQIRIFEKAVDSSAYTVKKTLDCSAVDINEITIRPNSSLYSYVTASCTDGNVYVWDTAFDDLPMCILEHGDPVEELLGEREQEDVGVKFTAWGTTADRLYTGSSDGVVKVWNIRHGRAVLVKDLIEASGPIIFGAFSPDFTKLVVGDGTGRVYVMSLEDDSKEEPQNQLQNKAALSTVSSGFLHSSAFVRLQVGGKQQSIRRPRPFIPHPEVPPPDGEASEDQLGHKKAAEYLKNGELVIHPDESIGAVQGPHYTDTGLFRTEAHLDGDVAGPLLGRFEALQQENTRYPPVRRFPRQRPIIAREDEENCVTSVITLLRDTHMRNVGLDVAFSQLDLDTQSALQAERAEMDPARVDYDFSYENE